MSANLENSAVATGLEKVSFHSNPKERQCQKCSNYSTIVLFSRASKIVLKIFQARLQQYLTENFWIFKLNLEKAEEPAIKLSTSTGSLKKQEDSRKKKICFIFLTKAFIVWISTNCGQFLKRQEYQTTFLVAQLVKNLPAMREIWV